MDKRSELERKTKEGDVFAGLELAELIETSGDVAKARGLYEWLAEAHENVTAAEEVARIAYETGDYNSIPKWLNTAVGNGGDTELFWENLTQQARSSDPAARTSAKTAIRVAADQGDSTAMIILAVLAKELGRRDTARHWYSNALKADAETNPELEEFCSDEHDDLDSLDGEDWSESLTGDDDD